MSKGDLHPSFRRKVVYNLDCVSCGSVVCRRGMKAILLADTKTEMFSTDTPEIDAVDAVQGPVVTNNCACRIQDVACTSCGSVVGYHVSMPCQNCLQSCNNGHFWMYYSEAVIPAERMDKTGEDILVWGRLFDVDEDSILDVECLR